MLRTTIYKETESAGIQKAFAAKTYTKFFFTNSINGAEGYHP